MSECKVGPCGRHCNCYNDIDYDKPGCQWCQILTENEDREKSWVEDRAKLSKALLQIGALKKFNVAEVMRHDSRVAALVLQIREVRPFLEALAEGNLIDARVKAQTILNDMEKPKGETFPLCECGHNHRTEPGHYTTMNCNMKGCPCTYFTEKPKSELPYCTVKRLDSLEGSICGIRLPCPHHAEKRKCEHRWTPINLDPDFDSQCMKCGAKENQA